MSLFSVRILSGLVRVGWVADEASADAVGTDETSFGFGGTGKKSHANVFDSFGDSGLSRNSFSYVFATSLFVVLVHRHWLGGQLSEPEAPRTLLEVAM
ncbi:RTCA [Symbiodinium necroappetens]|uniref:RTCA protein n=1 Tax=Symbiodinium necroappetens TaxID=1628268 RepID=A0A812ZKL7_9DINO|nr:RTCA [Symbiodinium necroappetens]